MSNEGSGEDPKPTESLPENPFSLRLSWWHAKSPLNEYTSSVWDDQLKTNDRFYERYRKEMEKIGHPSMLIYNLGHPNRGLTDFPRNVSIQTSNPTTLENGAIQVEVPTSSLLTQLADIIAAYGKKVAKKRNDPSGKPFERFVYPLQLLSEHIPSERITRITLSFNIASKGYMIDSIESVK